jgi:hypothetical protein
MIFKKPTNFKQLPNDSHSSSYPGAPQHPDSILHSIAPKVHLRHQQDDLAADSAEFDPESKQSRHLQRVDFP